MKSDLVKLRKDIHQYPEISGKEKKTAERIHKELQLFNPDDILTGLGGNGILAHFKCRSAKPKKSILFRAELDAISVREETGVSYQSQNENAMHGCGHDGHMTILIGLAKWLNENRPEHADVYLLFQPAEETGEGAAKVLEDSRFRELKIDHGFALHNLPGFPEKTVICKKNTFAAGSIGIEISVKGSFSHAAYPEKGLNPSLTVAKLIQRIENEMEPFRSEHEGNKLVCTFITMGERAFGISPGLAKIGFTIRSESDEKFQECAAQIQKLIKDVSKSFGGKITSKEVEPFRATVNSSEGTEIVKKVTEKNGLEYQNLDKPFPWSEDFGEFRRQFPITIFGLGAGEDHPPLHSEKYDFNDKLIPTGITMFAGIVDYYSSL
ncbi:MAG: amidohydrolase [Balneolaceae bacterium]|nr:amidohydrolase [Balneolaceae bacterium]